ncbi:hypothetical protein [Streptomyces sp. NPDC049879]|uniref:hypothetical protein n=1 Tax=Streptomyces sp. NPDC049879 TaxID=3365598 RepID=UPI0037B0231A
MSKLHVITGAPGAGKTALLPHLGIYPFASADFDELPEPDGRLLGIDITASSAGPVWPAYNRLWVKIATMMLRSGGPVLILCPLTPGEWASTALRDAAGPPHVTWARLDCSDTDRRARLAARGWDAEQIEDAVEDAAELRCVVDQQFTTTGRSPAEVAATVADWVTNGSE